MLIRMKLTKAGSRDGRFTENFQKGESYDLNKSRDLARVFLREGWADEIEVMDVATDVIEEVAPKIPTENLGERTIRQLKVIMKDLGVAIGDCRKKTDMVKAIKEHGNA